jgi:hypothetical protein
MDGPNLENLVDSWIAEWESEDGTSGSESKSAVSELHLDGEHKTLWEFVCAAYKKDMSPRVFSILAAGPLEDLLANFGVVYIDRVEALARQDPKFNELLGGVWKNSIEDEVWDRVIHVRNRLW